MADICPVCNKEIGFLSVNVGSGIDIHRSCLSQFNSNREKYLIEKTEAEKAASEQRTQEIKEHQEQKIEDKSVFVKNFDMPFEDMVTFIFKWTMASIPTAIFLAILFLIFTAIIS